MFDFFGSMGMGGCKNTKTIEYRRKSRQSWKHTENYWKPLTNVKIGRKKWCCDPTSSPKARHWRLILSALKKNLLLEAKLASKALPSNVKKLKIRDSLTSPKARHWRLSLSALKKWCFWVNMHVKRKQQNRDYTRHMHVEMRHKFLYATNMHVDTKPSIKQHICMWKLKAHNTNTQQTCLWKQNNKIHNKHTCENDNKIFLFQVFVLKQQFFVVFKQQNFVLKTMSFVISRQRDFVVLKQQDFCCLKTTRFYHLK